jgi:hypothetical protein
MDSKTKQLLEKIVERFEWEPMQFDLWEEAKEILSSEQEPDKAEIKLEYSTTLPDETPLTPYNLADLGFEIRAGLFYNYRTKTYFDWGTKHLAFSTTKMGKDIIFKTVGDLRKYLSDHA